MNTPFLIENEFFDAAETLRTQFEQRLAVVPARKSKTVFSWADSPDCYRFLFTAAEQVFAQEVVQAFLHRLRIWAQARLNVYHASSPQIHVYVRGCRRQIAPESVRARWHYLFSLTQALHPKIRVLSDRSSEGQRVRIGVSRVTSVQLTFNQLLVHETYLPYGVENASPSSDRPWDGSVLLHGYLW